jgi:hypothetical protein
MAASSFPPCLMLWQRGQAVIPRGQAVVEFGGEETPG